jgi:fatty acid desaturase
MPPIDPSQLWEIHGKYYDLTPFLDAHPGGKRMLMLGKGKDCTEVFESVHLFKARPEAMLARYFVADKEGHVETFSWSKDGFYETLRARVQKHFEGQAVDLGITRGYQTTIGHGTPWFLFRFWALFALFALVTFAAIGRANLWCALAWGPLAFVLGGYAHEGLHGGVFSSPRMNRLVALLGMDLNGLSSFVYSNVHVTAHHVYTNIEKVDPDIEIHYPLIREFSYQEKKWFHRFQHLYCWPIYAVALPIADAMDVQAMFARKWGKLPILLPYRAEMALLVLFKVLSTAYLYVLPHLLHDTRTALALNLCMILPASFLTNLNFALNHQAKMPMLLTEAAPPRLVLGSFRDWGELQVRTTCDYQHGRWWADMLFSGLNYQTEHHLFPLLSYSKLPEVAPIVRATCKEFGLPYHYVGTYWGAIAEHARFLKWMGRSPVARPADGPVPPEEPLAVPASATAAAE